MKTVRIYIETSFQRPAVRDGKYASALVFTGTDGDHELIVTGAECGTTYNRLTLLGAVAAMNAGEPGELAPVRMEDVSRATGAE